MTTGRTRRSRTPSPTVPARAGRRLVGARPGQPDRRAHRLQRRLRAAVRARRPDRASAAGRATTACCGCARSQRPGERRRRSRSPTCAPGTPDGWAAYVAGVVWALREAGHDVARRRPAGRRRRAARRRAVVVAALECAVAGRAHRPARHRASTATELAALAQRGRERLRRRADRDHGPDRRRCAAPPATRCSSTPARLDVEQVPLDLGAAGLRAAGLDTRVHHAHADGEYGDRRAACERAAAPARRAALRDVDVDGLDAALRPAARRRAAPPRAARRHRERAGARRRRARCGPADWRARRAAADRLARLAARRLRGHCAELDVAVETALGRRRARGPDDRRRLRRLGDRAGAGRAARRWARRSSRPSPAVAGPPRTSSRSRPRRAPVGTPDRWTALSPGPTSAVGGTRTERGWPPPTR